MKLRRVAVIIATILIALFFLASLGAWFFLARWVPVKGKALLIEEVERRGPLELKIETMRYDLFRGVVLEQVHLQHRDSGETWFLSPLTRVHISWMSWLMQRQLAFRLESIVEEPCKTELFLRGHYHPRQPSLTLHIHTSAVAVESLAPPLTRYVPSNLSTGILRLAVQLRHRANEPLLLSGTVDGTQLLWIAPSAQMRGDVKVSGQAHAPASPSERWSLKADIRLRNGTLQDLPTIDTISELEGRATVTDERLEIHELNGQALGSRWKLEGILAPLTPAAFEGLLTSKVELATLVAAFPHARSLAQMQGGADIEAVCRGPLQPTPFLDCHIHSTVDDATISGFKLTEPLTHLNARVDYDVLAKHLDVHHLEARLLDERFAGHGTIRWAPSPKIALNLTGTLPLKTLGGWLPSPGPVKEVTGRAEFDVKLEGPFDQLRVVATATVPEGELTLNAQLKAQETLLDEVRLILPQSNLTLTGSLARTDERASTLAARGTLELSELTHLPFFPLPALEPWKLQGRTEVEWQFQGRLADWTSANMRGRMQMAQGTIREMPITQLLAEVEQQSNVLRLRVPSALIAEGKLWGDLAIEPRGQTNDFLLQADLVNVQLATLSETIPAWRKRPLEGTASSHLLVSGTWEQRQSWRGEGWVNASGTQLGNLPLLDKVFRGLFGVLADRLGLETLRRAQITQASVQWRLTRERFLTENLRLAGVAGTEPVAVYAKGNVGFDQTLDFVIEPEFSEGALLQAPITSSFASTILKSAGQLDRFRRLVGRHRLTGTLQKPDYRFELSLQEVLNQLTPGPTELLQQLFDVVQ